MTGSVRRAVRGAVFAVGAGAVRRVARRNISLVDHVDTPDGDIGGGLTVLVVGSDARARLGGKYRAFSEPDTGARADAILLCVFAPGALDVQVLAIPRDIGVELPVVGYQRIGWALEYGGASMLVDAVRDLTAVPVHHVVCIDFKGFGAAVDACGGIDVEIEVPVRDRRSGLMLPRGSQRITGVQALALVRSRQQDVIRSGRDATIPLGDGVRRARLRRVVDGLVDRVRSGLGPIAAIRLATRAGGHVVVDPALADTVLTTLRRISGYTGVQMTELPTRPANVGVYSPFPPFQKSGATYLEVDRPAADAALDTLRNRMVRTRRN